MSENEKIILSVLGNSGVGKTSFIMKFTDNTFQESYLATYGIDFKTKYVNINNNKYRVDLYDTAGQERFRSISINSIRMSDGVILIYDITNESSYENISTWMDNIYDIKGKGFPVIIIGNKCDKEEERQVPKKKGEELAKRYKITFFETSNKIGTNIEETVLKIINQIIENNIRDTDNSIKLRRNRAKDKNSCC